MTQTMGTLIVLLSTGMWGISGVCGQYLFEHTQIDSTWLIAVRQILAGLMYMMVIVQRGTLLQQRSSFTQRLSLSCSSKC